MNYLQFLVFQCLSYCVNKIMHHLYNVNISKRINIRTRLCIGEEDCNFMGKGKTFMVIRDNIRIQKVKSTQETDKINIMKCCQNVREIQTKLL